MTDWLRRAGHGHLPDGSAVTWSIAEGRRGRRWREVRLSAADDPISSLLFETDSDGRFNHLELSTAAGLLTLHPEADGTIHGNSVGAVGVRHVVGLPWLLDGIVLLEGSAITVAAAACLLRTSAEAATFTTKALRIGLDLSVERREVRVDRLPYGTWRFEGHDPIGVGADGVPSLRAAEEWALEA